MPIDSYAAIILVNHEANCLFMTIKLTLYLPAFPGIFSV